MEGGEDEFLRFAATRFQQLYRSALLLCGEHYAAEDLVQEALAKVYAVWGTRAIDNPVAYTHTTLTRVFLGRRRRMSSREYPVEAIADQPIVDPDLAVRLDLQRALADLNAMDRAIVVMRYLEDRPVDEVAACVHKSPGAVRNRAGRALMKLRHLLEEPEINEPEEAKSARSTNEACS